MTTRKFWCHYIGRDGNTPKRASKELSPITELLPRMADVKGDTPLWYEKEDTPDCNWIDYRLYAQLNDKVALYINSSFTNFNVEEILVTDEQIKAQVDDVWKYDLRRATTEDERKEVQAKMVSDLQGRKERRELWYKTLSEFSNLTNYFLSHNTWITTSDIRAYEEINSPFLTTLKAIRQANIERRKEEDRQDAEDLRLFREEQARKEAEEEKREQERLTQSAQKFKYGKAITGWDVVSLCRRYGIKLHLRTIHNLKEVVLDIRAKDPMVTVRSDKVSSQGRCKVNLDGCWKAAQALYDYLQTHDNLEAA